MKRLLTKFQERANKNFIPKSPSQHHSKQMQHDIPYQKLWPNPFDLLQKTSYYNDEYYVQIQLLLVLEVEDYSFIFWVLVQILT